MLNQFLRGKMKKNNIHILCVLIDNGLNLENSSVFQSQVVNQFIHLSKIGYSTAILCFYREVNKFKPIKQKLEKNNIKVFSIKDKNSLILNILSACYILFSLQKKVNFFYVRGIWGALPLILVNPIKTPKYIFDLRGDLLSEMSEISSNNVKKKIIMLIEKISLIKSYKISAVTSHMSNKVFLEYNRKSITIPCCLNLNDYNTDKSIIAQKKKELGINENDIVFVYSGGLSHYQKVDQMLEIWKKFINHNNIKFMLLTNQDPHSHPITIKYLEDFKDKLFHFSLSQNDVKIYLKCCDLGFLLRDNNDLNVYASPVKFPEYLASGLSIVSTHNLGDISNLIVKHNLGVLIDSKNINESENKILNFLRSNNVKTNINSNKIIKEIYDWDANNSSFKTLYS